MSVRLHLEPSPPQLHEHCVEVAGHEPDTGPVGGQPHEIDSSHCPYCRAYEPLDIPAQATPRN